MEQSKLNKILEEHKKWLNGEGGTRANLCGANLCGANLHRANLCGANLHRANLHRANLSGADLRDAIGVQLICPEKGSFIGFKKCDSGLIVELEITEDAKRSSAATRKCRCSKAKVISITDSNGNQYEKAYSRNDFEYEVGKIVEPDSFDDDRWNECSNGIHFFITKQEAIDY